MFYLRLARQNLRSDRRIFLPFWLAETVLMALNITLLNAALESSKLLGKSNDGSYKLLFVFAAIIVMILSVLLSWYANNFLLKQRTRQLAVYNLIGFGRGELGVMLVTELFVLTLGAIVAGAIVGFLFGRLGVLALARIFGVSKGLGLAFNPLSILLAGAVIVAIMLSLVVIDLVWLKRHRPAELREAAKAGETQPKTRFLMLIIGVVATILGYYFALKKHRIDAVQYDIFIAIILVVIGTYALFIAGSVFVLKMLRRSERFYYKQKHFVSVGNLLYRMKQNGAGLASITILLTMTLLTLGTIVTAFAGTQDTARQTTPQDLVLTSYTGEDPRPKALPIVEKAAEEVGISAKVQTSGQIYQIPTTLAYENGRFRQAKGEELIDAARTLNPDAMTLETYNRVTGKNRTLDSNQVIVILDKRNKLKTNAFSFDDLRFNIKYRDFDNPLFDPVGSQSAVMFVVKNEAAIQEMSARTPGAGQGAAETGLPTIWSLEYQLTGSDRKQLALFNKISPALKKAYIYPRAYADTMSHLLQVFGGLMVVGGIIGLAFILATALILYDKQVSEGLADAGRFVTLRRVGLSDRETRATISRQLRVVFVLPPIVAAIHILGISPFMLYFFRSNNLAKPTTYFLAVAMTYLVILVVYAALYWLTKRVYYAIVARASTK